MAAREVFQMFDNNNDRIVFVDDAQGDEDESLNGVFVESRDGSSAFQFDPDDFEAMCVWYLRKIGWEISGN